ncbi:MAG: hypothetical protein K6G10_12230 [Butyrivibrio sp.]|nr:hypothetical protein [Butyrivibrio sp.]
MPKLTLLTYPLNDLTYKSDGHPRVTKSLVDGLHEIGYTDFNLNPDHIDCDHVHALFGPGPCRTLEYALDLKKKGIVKHVTAGPNIFVFPFESNYLINDPDLEMYLVPSYWNKCLFEAIAPDSADKLRIWPCGISKDLLALERRPQKKAILYRKNRCNLPESFYDALKAGIEAAGYESILFEYGKYRYEDYIRTLQECAFMVAVTDQEAQGLFLSESWALDVPTLCFEQGTYTWKNVMDGEDIVYDGTSACPYLTADTGVKFTNIDEFHQMMRYIDLIIESTSPRAWMRDNMTDAICAQDFLNILHL